MTNRNVEMIPFSLIFSLTSDLSILMRDPGSAPLALWNGAAALMV